MEHDSTGTGLDPVLLSKGSNEPKRKPIEETILAVFVCDAFTKKAPHKMS